MSTETQELLNRFRCSCLVFAIVLLLAHFIHIRFILRFISLHHLRFILSAFRIQWLRHDGKTLLRKVIAANGYFPFFAFSCSTKRIVIFLTLQSVTFICIGKIHFDSDGLSARCARIPFAFRRNSKLQCYKLLYYDVV